MKCPQCLRTMISCSMGSEWEIWACPIHGEWYRQALKEYREVKQ